MAAFFSLPVRKYRKSYCTTPGVSVGGSVGGFVGSDICFRFMLMIFLCDGQSLSGKLLVHGQVLYFFYIT